MAYICKQEFRTKNKAGARMYFESKVYANADGLFIFRNLPDAILLTLEQEGHSIHGRDRKLALRVTTKEEGIKAIKEAMEKQFELVTTSELVIHYSYTSTCHYWDNGDGTIRPNGTGAKTGSWSESIMNNVKADSWRAEDHDYSLGFKAEVTKKVTHTTGDKKRVVFERVEEEEMGQWGNKLNQFAKVATYGQAIEIPYTEDSAQVFYESMMRLCQISKQLSEFLSEPENILTAAGNCNFLE